MTNQSGIAITCRLTGECLQEDERKCRQHQGQGRVPQYQLAFCTLPAYRHYNTFHAAAPGFLDSLLHPLLHFTFVPAAAAPQFDGFREMTFTDQLVKPFICHASETGDVVHVDQGSSARSNTLSWPVIEVNIVRMSSVRFMEVGQMRVNLLN